MDGRTYGRTFAILESLSQLKIMVYGQYYMYMLNRVFQVLLKEYVGTMNSSASESSTYDTRHVIRGLKQPF